MILDMAGRDLFGRLTGGRFNLRPVKSHCCGGREMTAPEGMDGTAARMKSETASQHASKRARRQA